MSTSRSLDREDRCVSIFDEDVVLEVRVRRMHGRIWAAGVEVLLVVGILCLPAPFYLPVITETIAPPHRTTRTYTAEVVDPTQAIYHDDILDRHRSTIAVTVTTTTLRNRPDYIRAPARTNDVLLAAVRNGSATTTDPVVRADLRALDRRNRLLYTPSEPAARYTRFAVTDDGSHVTTTPISDARAVNLTITYGAYAYTNLSAAARATVDTLIERGTYRPPGVGGVPRGVARVGHPGRHRLQPPRHRRTHRRPRPRVQRVGVRPRRRRRRRPPPHRRRHHRRPGPHPVLTRASTDASRLGKRTRRVGPASEVPEQRWGQVRSATPPDRGWHRPSTASRPPGPT